MCMKEQNRVSNHNAEVNMCLRHQVMQEVHHTTKIAGGFMLVDAETIIMVETSSLAGSSS